MSEARTVHRVRVPWDNIRAALDLLESKAVSPFKSVIVGNSVCIDCSSEVDSAKLLATFQHARGIRTAGEVDADGDGHRRDIRDLSSDRQVPPVARPSDWP